MKFNDKQKQNNGNNKHVNQKIQKHKQTNSKNLKKNVGKSVSDASKSMVFHKQHGQNILINQEVLNKIVERACIKPSDIIIEIGPGTGNLTQLLLERAKKVIAYEIDPRMVSELTKRFLYSPLKHKLELIQGDFLKKDLPYFDLVVANVPYQISSPLIFKLLSHRPVFRSAILMFQKEFAQRLVAQAGQEQYCRLSVNVQLMSKTQYLFKVGPNNFRPPPKVDSAIVRIEPIYPPPPINYLEWDALLRICFVRKNKMLGAVFKNKKLIKILMLNYDLFLKNGSMKNDQITELSKEIIKKMTEDDSLIKKPKENRKDSFGFKDNDEDKDSDNQDDKAAKIMKFKLKLMDILESIDFREKRSTKLDINDFLKLLLSFNRKGIHFK